MSKEISVVIWNENVHEQENELVRSIYPNGIHSAIAEGIGSLDTDSELRISTATLQEPEHGLTEERLAKTDVLIWWGHRAHGDVSEEVVDRVQKRVLQGMGLIVLHSGHFSKIFKRMMGTSCALKWREAGERERLWVTNHGHPITQGIGECIELENTEMYGEPFGIPAPDEQVFISWFEGGEVFRSGCCWHRGNGKIFYFRPGHETYPIYHNETIHRVIYNAVKWAYNPSRWTSVMDAPNVPVEKAPETIELKGGSVHADGEAGFR
ncbi:ThuA domain-containing protein [Pelagicoccus mobilis]|uniref:ThuA domain-containing protein n=1 Tax=Pelagicoccus mobilis TaxID=415221 RepID=A0A934VR85_9BACT|nr:ThuA domain-containing protein [Pelagicoccus mobilis]MBK1879127.1 ThuA domain-containing protein [Pelagicoccus mobilis]